MFSQKELLAESDILATPEIYCHRTISEMKTSGNLDAQLLIGVDCLKAIEPQEVITSKGDGTYPLRKRLGWCIGGQNRTEIGK